MKINKNFYKPNFEATREMAEKRLLDKGYSNFTFKNVSRSHGVSFYFELEDGREARVSDHSLTGRRSMDLSIVEIPLYEIKTLSINRG